MKDLLNEQLIEDIISGYPKALMIADSQGRLMWVNAAFETMTGYLSEEVVGKKPKEFLHGEKTNLDTVRYMSGRVQEQKEFTAEILNYHKDGSSYWTYLTVKPIFIEGVLEYWIGSKNVIISSEELTVLRTKVEDLLSKSQKKELGEK